MANFIVNPGSGGSTFASDTITAVEYPLAKSAWGAAGAVNQTSVASPLPVQVISGAAVNTTGAITTAATTVGPVTMGSYVSVTVQVSGTYAGVNFGFWASNDGTTYWPVNAVRSDTGVYETTTGVLTANQTRAWDVDIGGANFFKVISTAFTSGSAAISILQNMEEGSPSVAAITQGPAAAATAILGNPTRIGGTFTTALPTYTTGQQTDLQTTARGEVYCALSIGAVSATVKAASTAAATTDTALVVSMAGANSAVKIGDGTNNAAVKAASTAAAATDPAAVVSLSPNSPITLPTPSTSIISSAATTNATSVKATAGTVYSLTANNTAGTAAFIKLYNLATAPTVGTSVPTLTFSVPANGSINVTFGTSGARFATGIALAITNLGTDADATAVTAAQIKSVLAYI